MKWYSLAGCLVVASVFASCGRGTQNSPAEKPISLQLNWTHDPTFAGEYIATAAKGRALVIKEGGPNVYPLPEVQGGRATAAVVGADIFLEAIDKYTSLPYKCFFVDFQRNPVGWVLHPDAAKKAGLPPNLLDKPLELNNWLFQKIAEGKIRVGDKRGTETTSVWIEWARIHQIPKSIKVTPVGFDSAVVLSAPMMIYPVYLNEEPFKLDERIGRPVVTFDPAADGVELYGNVIVISNSFVASEPAAVAELRNRLKEGWIEAKSDISKTATRVGEFYKGASHETVKSEVAKTVEFVFYRTDTPGIMDRTGEQQWGKTLRALQQSGLVSQNLTWGKLKEYIIP